MPARPGRRGRRETRRLGSGRQRRTAAGAAAMNENAVTRTPSPPRRQHTRQSIRSRSPPGLPSPPPSSIITVQLWTQDDQDHSLAELEIRCEGSTLLSDVQETACSHLSVLPKYEHSCYIWLQLTSESTEQTTKHFLQGRSIALQFRSVNIDVMELPQEVVVTAEPSHVTSNGDDTPIVIDEYSVACSDLVHITLDAIASSSSSTTSLLTSGAPSIAPVFVIRLSAHPQYQEARGKSHVYKIHFVREHTIGHLAHSLAVMLK
eukprot:6458940-Amphidinium_carterae.1